MLLFLLSSRISPSKWFISVHICLQVDGRQIGANPHPVFRWDKRAKKWRPRQRGSRRMDIYIERSGTFGYLYFRDMDGGIWHDWYLRGRISDQEASLKTSVFQMFQDCLNSVRLYFFFFGSKITADGDCSHEIKRCLLLGRKVMTNLDSIFKSRDITLPIKVRLLKAMVFPMVTYGCESWTVKKAECWRIDAFELWCWRRLLRVSWTARRFN